MKRRWFPTFGRARRDVELEEELRGHLRMAAEERIARGESATEATANARREFGNVGQVQEITREMWGGLWIERLAQDLRFGVRTLRRNPGFTMLAVLCLTLGIGANAAVYSWIEGVLLRPYPGVVRQDRLLVITGTNRAVPGHDALSWPDFSDLRAAATLFDAVVADKITGATLSNGDRAEHSSGQVVSANYFDAIGVNPLLGRGFLPGEETGRNAHPVTVISYRMWQDRFKADPRILGKTQVMNGVPHTIIGVAPEGFVGTFVGVEMQFWVPVSMQETFDLGGYKLEDRGAHWVESFGRLKPGITREQAQQELQALARQLEARYPETNKGRGIELYPLWKSPFNAAGDLFPTLRIALVVAVLVLLIACANVSNLLLVRALARRQELTVRLAIGSGRGRLVRQLMTESLLLTALAAAGGLLMAYWSRNLLVLVIPPRSAPINLPAALDWRVLAMSAGVCLVTTLLFTSIPALQAGRIDLAGVMRSEGGGVVGGSGRSRVGASLVLLQIAVSFVLLVGAGLLVKSLQVMRSANPGFVTQNVLITALDLNAAGYDAARRTSFRDELINRVQAIPGVESAAYARIAPFSYRTYSGAPITIEGYQAGADEQPAPDYDEVSPGYFTTLGIPIVSGRDFSRADDDGAPPVAIVNEAMAVRYLSGANPLGRVFQLKGRRVQVVGVARNAHYSSLLEPARPFYYIPLRQNPAGYVILCLRTSLDRGAGETALRNAVHALDPGLASAELISMREQVDRQSWAQTVALSLMGGFGALALLLAAVGLFGVMSYAVSQSSGELGLRMALGAGAADLLRLVLANGLTVTLGGILLGAATALGTTRLMGSLLYRVSPRDPFVFIAAILVLVITAAAACLPPAWRASRTDPVRALRT